MDKKGSEEKKETSGEEEARKREKLGRRKKLLKKTIKIRPRRKLRESCIRIPRKEDQTEENSVL